jgi:hypothetical protein
VLAAGRRALVRFVLQYIYIFLCVAATQGPVRLGNVVDDHSSRADSYGVDHHREAREAATIRVEFASGKSLDPLTFHSGPHYERKCILAGTSLSAFTYSLHNLRHDISRVKYNMWMLEACTAD